MLKIVLKNDNNIDVATIIREKVAKQFSDEGKPFFKVFQEEVFPFIKNLSQDRDSGYAKYMEDAIFIIPTPIMLQKVVTAMDKLEMKDRDTKGDVYEYHILRDRTRLVMKDIDENIEYIFVK